MTRRVRHVHAGRRPEKISISRLERNHSLRSGNKALRSGHPLPRDLRLASVRCLAHNDSSVGGVTPWSRRHAPLFARKESTYDDEAPAHDPTPPTHVGRLAAPELLCAYHARVSALCRGFRQAFWDLPRASWPRAGPHLPALSCPGKTGSLAHRRAGRLCPALLLSCHAQAPGHD